MCEQERAGQGCLMSEWIALGGCVPGGRLRSGPFRPLRRALDPGCVMLLSLLVPPRWDGVRSRPTATDRVARPECRRYPARWSHGGHR